MQKPRGWSEDLAIAKAQRDNEQARAAARKKLSDSRLSGMQKEYAHNQHYQIKISNESPYTLSLAVLIGTPDRFIFWLNQQCSIRIKHGWVQPMIHQ